MPTTDNNKALPASGDKPAKGPASDPAAPLQRHRWTRSGRTRYDCAVGSNQEAGLIFITAKFRVQHDHADRWPDISRSFTEATRAESGCLWFDWSRSLDDPDEYVLVEAFRDGAAGGEHVQSAHFKQATAELPQYLQSTPKIVNFEVEQDDWAELGELAVKD